MKYILGISLWLFTCMGIQAQALLEEYVTFRENSLEMTRQGKQKLDELIYQLFTLDEPYEVMLRGYQDYHPDAVGRNAGLVKSRMDTVQRYLIKQGVSVLPGDIYPSEATNRSANKIRSIEVSVSLFVPEGIEDLFEWWAQRGFQRYQIDPKQPTQIVGSSGTLVWIEAGTFEYTEIVGAPREPITILLKEAPAASDLIKAHANTIYDQQLIAIQNAVYLLALDGEQPLRIREGKRIRLGFPTEGFVPGTELFKGLGGEQITQWRTLKQEAFNDLAVLLGYPAKPKEPEFEYTEPNFSSDDTSLIEPPMRPKKPEKPRKPTLEDMKDSLSFGQRLGMSRRTKEKKLEEFLAKALKKYEVEVNVYREEVFVFEKELALYRADSVLYQKDADAYTWRKDHSAENFTGTDLYKDQMERQKELHEIEKEKHRQVVREWEAKREQFLEEYLSKFVVGGYLNSESSNNYYVNVPELGWIACGNQMVEEEEEPDPKLDPELGAEVENSKPVTIVNPSEAEGLTFVLLKNQPSLVYASVEGDQYSTRALPVGSMVSIVSMKVFQGNLQLAIQDVQVGLQDVYRLDYEQVTLGEMEKRLDSLIKN